MPRKGKVKHYNPIINKGTTTQLWRSVYKSDQYREFKLAVRKAHDNECKYCFTKGSFKNKLSVHHHKPKAKAAFFKLMFNPRNAVVLCNGCHVAEHRKIKHIHPEYETMKPVTTESLIELLKDLTFNYYHKKNPINRKSRRRVK